MENEGGCECFLHGKYIKIHKVKSFVKIVQNLLFNKIFNACIARKTEKKYIKLESII